MKYLDNLSRFLVIAEMRKIKKNFGIVVSLLLVSAFIPLVLFPPSVLAQSPFATEVVEHSLDMNESDYKDPGAVLGEPTKGKDSFGNYFSMVFPAWEPKTITRINDGSYIEVKFDHKVKDDPDNPFGIDLIVFGNSMCGGEGRVESSTNMEDYHITSGANEEPVLVAVSQDGDTWYNYTDGSYGDTEFPTNAYKWDRENDTWGDQLDFTKPVDPSIDSADFVNMSVADVIDDYYKGSAGGTGFDLAPSGYSWIQYIKVYGDADHKGGEIDAFADVSPVSVSEASVYVRVEGQNETIWRGNVTVSESDITADNSNETYHLSDPTLLGALDEASDHEERFPYYVTDKYGGLYVKSIDEEKPSGVMSGWMYRVDYYSPSVGAGNFTLGETTPSDPPHSELVWYYGSFGEKMLRITSNDTTVKVNQEVEVKVEYLNESSDTWVPVKNAEVEGTNREEITDSEGIAKISLSSTGETEVYAEKEGYVRSDKLTFVVGASEGNETLEGNPEANVTLEITGEVMPAVSFSVEPEELSFGRFGPGYTVEGQDIRLENHGSWNLLIETEVVNSDLYRKGLYLGNVLWSNFRRSVPADPEDFLRTLNVSTELEVSSNYPGVGKESGTLILWATPEGPPEGG